MDYYTENVPMVPGEPRKGWLSHKVKCSGTYVITLCLFASQVLYRHRTKIEQYMTELDYEIIFEILDTKEALSALITFYAKIFGITLSKKYIRDYLGHDEPVPLLRKIRSK